MELRQFGFTGIKVSALGFGAGHIGDYKSDGMEPLKKGLAGFFHIEEMKLSCLLKLVTIFRVMKTGLMIVLLPELIQH